MTDTNGKVERITPEHTLWARMVEHLQVGDWDRWVLDPDGNLPSNLYLIGITEAGRVVGHISIQVQGIVVPATEWSDNKTSAITNHDGMALRETFVQTFGVEEVHRRKGYGRILQAAAIDLSRELGAYQMRSWSSLDKPANYALKVSMGFAVCPAIYEVPSTGQKISGVYFVQRL